MEFTLKPSQLKALGERWAGVKNRISPFSIHFNANADGPSAGDRDATLRQMGLLDDRGEYTAPARRTLEVLATPRSFVRIQYTGTPELFEYFIYTDPRGGAPVSLAVTPRALQCKDPAAAADILAFLRDCIGTSPHCSSAFDAALPAAEALALTACLDLQRRAYWQALIDGKAFTPSPLQAAMVDGEISDRQKPAAQRFSAMLHKLLSVPPVLSPNTTAETLAALASKGFLTRKTQAGETIYTLAGEPHILATRMLFINAVLKLQSARQADGDNVTYSEALFLQSGVFDLLQLEATTETVHMQGISAARLSLYLKAALHEEAGVKGDAAPAQQDWPPPPPPFPGEAR